MITHDILGDKVHVYKRENSRFWQCSTFLNGRNHRVSTKEESLSHAKEFAEDWYIELRGKSRAGILKPREKTFAQVADQFEIEYEAITEGQRSEKWVKGHKDRLRLHLRPFFGAMGISEVTAGKVQDYRVMRAGQPARLPKPPKLKSDTGTENVTDAEEKKAPEAKLAPPARSTIHDEIVTLRQVLKTAIRHGWISHLPDLSPPYKTQGKIVHRPWFSPAEYKALYKATRAHHNAAKGKARWSTGQLHDFVLFMGNTGLRPDEAMNLQHRDVTIVMDEATGQRILEIEVRGKRGVGYCKSMPGGVLPYERLRDRPKLRPYKRLRKGEEPAPPILPEPMDHLFPGDQVKLFNRILDKTQLKFDRDGLPRTAYSLRHTYICLRLMEGADIYQIAKNCRTSVEMIEKFYAAHIKNTLDAGAINVRRARSASGEVLKDLHAEEEDA